MSQADRQKKTCFTSQMLYVEGFYHLIKSKGKAVYLVFICVKNLYSFNPKNNLNVSSKPTAKGCWTLAQIFEWLDKFSLGNVTS